MPPTVSVYPGEGDEGFRRRDRLSRPKIRVGGTPLIVGAASKAPHPESAMLFLGHLTGQFGWKTGEFAIWYTRGFSPAKPGKHRGGNRFSGHFCLSDAVLCKTRIEGTTIAPSKTDTANMKKSPQQRVSKSTTGSKAKDINVAIPQDKAAGAAAGAVVGGVVAGPIGAVVGGVVGTLVTGNTDKVKKAVSTGAKALAKKTPVVKTIKAAAKSVASKTSKAITGAKNAVTAKTGKTAGPKKTTAKPPVTKSKPAPKAAAQKPVAKKPAAKAKPTKPVATTKKSGKKG